ncbi:dienelactone hydrolase family protein [Prosthecobacter sp.]|uniref:alpha/beta hydrolase family protein n=1 Tax=Prosthecobacter sp. TaxID=1965333 RepID=UPI00378312F8
MKLPLFSAALLALAAHALAQQPETLPDTQPLIKDGDISEQMHAAALEDMDQLIADSVKTRAKHWHRDFSSTNAYTASVHENRERFKHIIGLRDKRVPVALERYGDETNLALVGKTKAYRIYQVRWPVLEQVSGEGLLLEPKGQPKGYIIALPDADQTPEQIAGLAPGVPAEAQIARRFVENGFAVIVPVLINRSDAGSGNPAILMTNMPHREWLHRQAYMMGRHIIGYEVQKVLALVDWINIHRHDQIGVAGYGEGGLIAMYAAAADQRIDATLVSGYFKSRQRTWREPLYRNVWGLLAEFGDAEIASLIAPRGLVIHYTDEPDVDGPPAPKGKKNQAAPGRLSTPEFDEVEEEYLRIDSLVPPGFQRRSLVRSDAAAANALAKLLKTDINMALSRELPQSLRQSHVPSLRQFAQMKEIEAHVQRLIRGSDQVRNDFFLFKAMPEFRNDAWTYAQFADKKPDKFIAATKDFRKNFSEEILGKIDSPLPTPKPRTRKIYDKPKWTGYEVVLDVGGEGFAWGVLLLPKDLKADEKRPVVVCQHGRHGIPSDVIEGDKPAYHDFAAHLAERGFITLAPHNLYKEEEQYRTLSRKGNTVKASMFSVMLRHHEQWLNWLGSLPQVDAKRIGFYGLSYGGESAVRIPPLLDGYCLSICSGDFNDWTRKVATTEDKHSFMFTDEWEMPYFNMGSTFSYAELTYLMFPRPFMVERGHHDGVSIDPWVAYEYAKTRWLYAQFGLEERTEIEFFNGGHTINGKGTFSFLHKQLNWPER